MVGHALEPQPDVDAHVLEHQPDEVAAHALGLQLGEVAAHVLGLQLGEGDRGLEHQQGEEDLGVEV